MQQRDWPTTLVPLMLLGASIGGAVLLTFIVPAVYPPSTAWFFLPLAGLVGVARWVLGGLPRGSRPARATFWALAVVQLPLVLLNPVFGLVAFFGYVDVPRQLRGHEAAAGLVVTAVICSMAQAGGVASPLFTPLILALFVVINVLIAGGIDDDAERERRLSVVDETGRKALTEVRRSVQALSSPRLDEADLPAAVDGLLDSWRDGGGGVARLIVDGDPRPSDNDPALLRIVQAALSNASRHARAGTVQVELGYEPDHVRVTVADDGVGSDPAAARQGMGLPGMRSRAREADGDLAVDSTPGEGTIVTATVPGRWR